MGRFTQTLGDGVAVTFNIDHNFNTKNVIVQVWQESDGAEIECDVTRTTVNRVTLDFIGAAPTAAQYRVVILG